MADNIIAPGASEVLAFDEVVINSITVKVPRTKLGYGADGTYTGDVSPALPMPVGRGAITATTINIANAASLSSATDLGISNRLLAIQMPAAWTAAVLTFQASVDGTNYYNLMSDAGVEVQMTVSSSQTISIQNPAQWLGARYIKIRSGTSATPVSQGASRDLIVATSA